MLGPLWSTSLVSRSNLKYNDLHSSLGMCWNSVLSLQSNDHRFSKIMWRGFEMGMFQPYQALPCNLPSAIFYLPATETDVDRHSIFELKYDTNMIESINDVPSFKNFLHQDRQPHVDYILKNRWNLRTSHEQMHQFLTVSWMSTHIIVTIMSYMYRVSCKVFHWSQTLKIASHSITHPYHGQDGPQGSKLDDAMMWWYSCLQTYLAD